MGLIKSKSMANPIHIYEEAVDLPSVAANTSAEVDITVTGVETTDVVLAVAKPTLEAGLLVGSARVKAANTISVQVANVTAGAIDEISETWTITIMK